MMSAETQAASPRAMRPSTSAATTVSPPARATSAPAPSFTTSEVARLSVWLISARASRTSCRISIDTSSLSSPRSSPKDRSSRTLTPGIASSRRLVRAGSGDLVRLRSRSNGAIPGLGGVGLAGLSLRALQEPCGEESERERAADHERRLAAGELLEVVAHRAEISVAEIPGEPLRLPGHAVGIAGEVGLVLLAEMIGRVAEGVGHVGDLIGQPPLAVGEARGRAVACLGERGFRLVDDLVLHVTDLGPDAAGGGFLGTCLRADGPCRRCHW